MMMIVQTGRYTMTAMIPMNGLAARLRRGRCFLQRKKMTGERNVPDGDLATDSIGAGVLPPRHRRAARHYTLPEDLAPMSDWTKVVAPSHTHQIFIP